MSTMEKSKLYQKFLKEEINGCPNLKSLFPFLKSPDKTQEKELNGVSQLFVPGQDHVKPFGTSSRKHGSKINLMDFASNMNNEAELFMSPIKYVEGDRIIDLNKRLNEELIKNTSLEAKVKELDFQNSSLFSQLDSLRQHLQDQSNNFMENRNQFEENHAKLMTKLLETENLLETTGKINECLKLEMEGMKRELDEVVREKEATDREREELGKRGEAIALNFNEKDRQFQAKQEEAHNLQKKLDSIISDFQMQKNTQEKANEKIKQLEEEKEEIRRRWEERVKVLNGELERSRGEGRVLQMENDKMRMEISNLNGQLQEKILCSENIKNDFYSIKQQLMEKHQKEMNLVLALEKANLEINNLRTLVNKAELNCEELKSYNKTLIQKISDFASNISNSSQSTQNLLNNLYEIHLDKNLKDNFFLMNKQEYPKIQSNPINMIQMENNNSNFMKNERIEMPVKMNNNNNNNEKFGSNSFNGGNRTMNNTANNIFGSTIKNNNFMENAEGGRGGMERELNDLIEKKKNMETELRKIEDSKFKTGANIRRKHELEAEIDNLEKTIPQIRLRMRSA